MKDADVRLRVLELAASSTKMTYKDIADEVKRSVKTVVFSDEKPFVGWAMDLQKFGAEKENGFCNSSCPPPRSLRAVL